MSQRTDDGLERPCVLMSKTLNECQSTYHSNEKEALALVESLKLCEILMGPKPKIEVYSDNLTTVYLDSLSSEAGKLFRYKMFLNRFDIKVHHKEGKLNSVADMLSRLQYDGQSVVSMGEETDKHAVISEGHCPFDPIITGEVPMPPELVCAVEDYSGFPGVKPEPVGELARPERMGFCMFDLAPISNHSHLPSDMSQQTIVTPERDLSQPSPCLDRTSSKSNKQTNQNMLDHLAKLPQQKNKHNKLTDKLDQQPSDNLSDAGTSESSSEFMKEDNNILFDDWEDIMNQQVLDVYSYVLRSTRELAIEQATDIDSDDMYAYKQNMSLPENFDRSKRVLAEEDRYKLTTRVSCLESFSLKQDRKCAIN